MEETSLAADAHMPEQPCVSRRFAAAVSAHIAANAAHHPDCPSQSRDKCFYGVIRMALLTLLPIYQKC